MVFSDCKSFIITAKKFTYTTSQDSVFKYQFFFRTFYSDSFILLKYKKKLYVFSKSLWFIRLVLLLPSLTKNGEKAIRIFYGRLMVDPNTDSKNEIMMRMVFMMQGVLAFSQGFCLLHAYRVLLDFWLNKSVWLWWEYKPTIKIARSLWINFRTFKDCSLRWKTSRVGKVLSSCDDLKSLCESGGMTPLSSLLGSVSVIPSLLLLPFASSLLASWPCHQDLNVALQYSLYWQSVCCNSFTQHRLTILIQLHIKTLVLIIHSPLAQWISLKVCVKYELNS